MKPRHLEFQISLSRPRAEVFPFFADARNLELITPPWLKFSIVTPGPLRMGQGALIDYRLKVRGIPIRWRTEITAWEPPAWFVDQQRKGPYRLWIHEHRFLEHNGATEVTDNLTYIPRGGWLVDWIFVRRDVQKLFAFRQIKLRALFGG